MIRFRLHHHRKARFPVAGSLPDGELFLAIDSILDIINLWG